jgi:DNA (cytosine-5)-methyltransferase 1
VNATVLFAGCGGSSLGLERAGYHTVGYEYWNRAVDTHNANGMECHLHDLSHPAGDNDITPCDLLWASPPCQPFSAAGDGEGENDDRDGFPWTLRIIAKLLPPVVIIENVKGLTFAKHADYFSAVLRHIAALGYRVDWRVLNSADYGVPQTRERCFIVARRDNGPITWPAPTHAQGDSLFLEPWVTMAEALGWGMTERPFSTITVGHLDAAGVGGSGARAALYAERDSGRWVLRTGANTMKHGRTDADVVPYERSVDEPAPTVDAKAAGAWTLDRRQNGAPLMDVGARPSPAVATVLGQWTINDAIRLTIAELAKLQGFPDDYVWTGTKTDQARMIGNAVPPVMAQVLAEANRPATR